MTRALGVLVLLLAATWFYQSIRWTTGDLLTLVAVYLIALILEASVRTIINRQRRIERNHFLNKIVRAIESLGRDVR